MLTRQTIKRLLLLLSILFIAAFCGINFFLMKNGLVQHSLISIFSVVCLSGFYISFLMFSQKVIKKEESKNFVLMIWRTVSITVIVMLTIMVLKGLSLMLGYPLNKNKYLINLFYHIKVVIIYGVIAALFSTWKRLTLYQKSKRLTQFWKTSEYLIWFSVVFSFAPHFLMSFQAYVVAYMLVLGMVLFVLSVNQKWIAYLDFSSKIQALFLTMGLSLTLLFFVYILGVYERDFHEVLVFSVLDSPIFLLLLWFSFVYSIIAFLILLFNLPTSSVLEEKATNIVGFQLLSDLLISAKSQKDIIKILVDNVKKYASANAAWFEAFDDGERAVYHSQSIDRNTILKLHKAINKTQFKGVVSSKPDNTTDLQFFTNVPDSDYKSLFATPLFRGDEPFGQLYLVKDVTDGFNIDLKRTIEAYANQASSHLSNLSLMRKVFENERYKEELKIAERVHSALLPRQLPQSEAYNIASFTISANEIGGDYYDVYCVSQTQYVVIIGDVSGKGTSAAFHMAQMKGLFYGLVQDKSQTPASFLSKANLALSKMLSKKDFITLTYLMIDTDQKEIVSARAGHCPTLYYNAKKQVAEYLVEEGIGLGLLRSNEYNKFVDTTTLRYQPEDIICLFTDGIPEAKNESRAEYGYDRILTVIETHADETAQIIANQLAQDIQQYAQMQRDDDYSCLIIKFV